MKRFKKFLSVAAACGLFGASVLTFAGCSEKDEVITLRVCNWEEYIDLGGWDEDERIELDNGDIIFGEDAIYDEFAKWFNTSDFGFKVKVEYSTFGTNEDLYNRLSLGDVYDLVCPSDYMIMKLIAEDRTVDYSDGFWAQKEENYYAENVSPYIDGAKDSIFTVFDWHQKAACYMWGTTGIVYTPEKVDDVAVSTWNILLNEDYKRQVTIKDNVRDAYFAALGILNSEKLTDPQFDKSTLTDLMNATDSETIAKAEDILKEIKNNVYSFETDSGKADMVTGKVLANYQWSGDAITILDGADADGTELWYSVPNECANLWFDGWVMLKSGIDGNEKKQTAAEAFVNFLSRPDNAVRNMYYIGYTSAIAGGTVLEYLDDTYGAEPDAPEEDVFPYDLTYFFGEETFISAYRSEFKFDDETDTSTANRGRQLFAQYPPENVKSRSVVMRDFEDKLSEINQMWINVRCLDVKDISPVTIGIICGAAGLIAIAAVLYGFRYKLFIKHKSKNGFEKVENQ